MPMLFFTPILLLLTVSEAGAQSCTTLLDDFSSETSSLNTNNWGGISSDDMSMLSRPIFGNGSVALSTSPNGTSYFFLTSPTCQNLTSFPNLHIRLAAPPRFSMRINLQSAIDCKNTSNRTSSSVMSSDYVTTFATGEFTDIVVPLELFGAIDSTQVTGLVFDMFQVMAENQRPHLALNLALDLVEFANSSCTPSLAPEAQALPCGIVFNDFNDEATATTLNTLGGTSNDNGSMALIEPNGNGALRLRSRDITSYWFTRTPDTCLSVVGQELVFMSVVAPVDFDMRVDLLTSMDCDDPNAPLNISSVYASDYVSFDDDTSRKNLSIPLKDFGNFQGHVTALQIGEFRNPTIAALPVYMAPNLSIEIDEVSLRPLSCNGTFPPSAPKSCVLQVETFTQESSVNELGGLHGDAESMDTVAFLAGRLVLSPENASSFWFTNFPSCFNASFYEGVIFDFQRIAASDIDFEIQLLAAKTCADNMSTTVHSVLLSELGSAQTMNEINMSIPFDLFGIDPITENIVSLQISSIQSNASNISVALNRIDLYGLSMCPLEPITTLPPSTTSPNSSSTPLPPNNSTTAPSGSTNSTNITSSTAAPSVPMSSTPLPATQAPVDVNSAELVSSMPSVLKCLFVIIGFASIF